MNFVYLFSKIDHEDVSSTVFLSKKKAEAHIAKTHPEYRKNAENTKEDITYWRKSSGEGLLLEKLQVEDQ
jgi:hypothetical protein